ncbi:MAG: hypothetical protein ACRET3_09655, partial [Burkholderiales bacterium]
KLGVFAADVSAPKNKCLASTHASNGFTQLTEKSGFRRRPHFRHAVLHIFDRSKRPGHTEKMFAFNDLKQHL